MKSKEITLIAIFAALYSTLVISLPGISFSIIQLRIADMLIPLSAIFGWPVIIGTSLGCFIANAFFSIGWMDYIFGPIANILAGYVIYKLKNNIFIGCFIASFIIGFIVGGYLWLFLTVPSFYRLEIFAPWLISIISISISSFITLNILGYTLVKILLKRRIFIK
ncbi:MAG: QueT transporter family protein [Nitrososphaerota archaeon]